VQDKLAYRFEDIGEREVKNMTRPLHVFWVLPGCAATPAATGSHAPLLMCTCAAPTSTRGGCQPPATGS
jgi:hypothetical protein